VNVGNANIFIVTAPSGAGKTSLVSQLIHDLDDIQVSISHTTRPKRSGEVDGENYHFVDKPTFEKMIEDNLFLEHADVFGNYYGTSVPAVVKCVENGNDVILEIDWQGAEQARKRLAGTESIFVLPPSRDVLFSRLQNRGTDSDDVIKRRTLEAVEEMRHYHDADYLLINDDFDQTLEEFKAIIISRRAARGRREREFADLIEDLIG